MSIVFDGNYYKKVISEFGYDPLKFSKIEFNLGILTKQHLQARWLCHNKAQKFACAFNSEEKVIVTTGIGLSAPPHVGTLAQILNSIYLQKAGIDVQMVLGDLDAYNGKNIGLNVTRDLAKKYKEFILKLGFQNSHGSVLRDQYNALEILRTMYLMGKYMNDEEFNKTEEDLHGFYVKRGKVDQYMTYGRKLSLALMISDFIDLFISSNYVAVLVMLGIDEHKYVLFAQQVFDRIKRDGIVKNNYLLAAIYSHMNKGFNNYPKMSKSFSDSSVNANMNHKEIIKRIMEEEGEFNRPEESPVYQMMTSVGDYTPEDLSKRYTACKSKNKIWMKYKREYAEMLIDIFKKWQNV